jgi:hypothetical protein
MLYRRWLSFWSLTFVLTASGIIGCNKSEKSAETTKTTSKDKGDGGAALPSGVDPDIANAVQQIAKNPGSALANGEKAPPPNGVFPAGQADKEIAAGMPPKLTLGNAGSAPKLSLRPVAFDSTLKREGTATLSIRTGPRAALPSLDLVVSFSTSAPKAEGDQPKPSFVDVTGRLTTSKLSAEQPGKLPAGLEKAAKSLEGSRVLYRLAPGGGVSNLQVEAKPGAEEGLLRVFQSFAEFLPVVHGPYPSEPVGSGALWMVTSRETIAGVDSVTYRMVRVEQIDGTKALLSVGTKRYAAGDSVTMPGVPPNTIGQFQCEGNGRLVIDTTSTATDASLQEALLAAISPKSDPSKHLNLQFQTNADLSFAAAH